MERKTAFAPKTQITSVVFLLLGYKAEWHPWRDKISDSFHLGGAAGQTQRDSAVEDQSKISFSICSIALFCLL